MYLGQLPYKAIIREKKNNIPTDCKITSETMTKEKTKAEFPNEKSC